MLDFENPAVELVNLTKKFGNLTVLKNLNFKVPKGKIVTILGFSGAGKSTLLKHLLGLLHPTEGQVKVLGQDLENLSKLQLREFRKNFGMVFQYAALFDSLTAFENVAFPMREFTNMSELQIKNKVKNLLLSVNIEEDFFYNLPSELSGGMRKRVGLARALALSPKVMLYDEPTTGLDPITTHAVNNLIIDMAQMHKEENMTSIIISHDVRASLKISDYLAFLNKGQIVEYLPVDEFIKSENPLVREFLEL
ncbi:MAG: ATP-binding cassette domain-containing protein [Halobacteriovoraceae bacterium]|nr:ATP-binding cassette domain-containing protein [Halobacteriovoraceae bacterium]